MGTLTKNMPEPRHPEQRLHIAAAGAIGADFLEAGIQLVDNAAGEVHHSDDVLETGMLRRRIDPPGSLQLMNEAKPLDPRMIDSLPLRNLPLLQLHAGSERDIAVNRIVAEVFAEIGTHGGSKK